MINYPALSKLCSLDMKRFDLDFCPLLLKVWDYGSRLIFNSSYPPDLTTILPISFRDTNLQMIVSATDYVLGPGMDYEDPSWLYEGVYPEQIIMTGVYYCHRDQELEGGEIEFRRRFDDKDAYFLMNCPLDVFRDEPGPENPSYPRSTWFNNIINTWMKPLGKLSNFQSGDVIVFPNCHSHRFKKLHNPLPDRSLHQRLIHFYLVHPRRPIISSADSSSMVANRSKISLTDALNNRSQLRNERMKLIQNP